MVQELVSSCFIIPRFAKGKLGTVKKAHSLLGCQLASPLTKAGFNYLFLLSCILIKEAYWPVYYPPSRINFNRFVYSTALHILYKIHSHQIAQIPIGVLHYSADEPINHVIAVRLNDHILARKCKRDKVIRQFHLKIWM